MASPSPQAGDLAYTPPDQANAYGPGVTFTAADPNKGLSDLGKIPPDGGLRQGEVMTVDPKYRAARQKEMQDTGR